jgi:hypothetical protein
MAGEEAVDRVEAVVTTCAAVLRQSPVVANVDMIAAIEHGENRLELLPDVTDVCIRKLLPTGSHASTGGESWLSCRAPEGKCDKESVSRYSNRS